MTENFQEDLQEVYQKTLNLAVSITQNKSYFLGSQPNQNDLKFIKKFEKEYTDFKKLSSRRALPAIQSVTPDLPSVALRPSHNFISKDSGKLKLNHSLQERKSYVSTSKAGKPVRYSGAGPDILEKIKLNASANLEDSLRYSINDRPSNLPHVSITTGKLKKHLELPSFKEYIQSQRLKDLKTVASERINKCEKQLEDFSKELNGLEIFLNSNPGVKWNLDKKVLMRLQAYPNQRALIIKAYNDQFETPVIRSPQRHKTYNEAYKSQKTEKFLSKTPNQVNKDEDESYYFPELKKKKIDPKEIVERCCQRFRLARDNQNKNLIKIVESLNSHREKALRHKAQFILNDNEKFKDKNYSIRKMNEIKKKIDLQQEIRIKKSKKQVVLYELLMEFLKKKPKGPSEAEINFVEIVKNILEEGWFISLEIVRQVVESFEEFEVEDLEELVEYLKSLIENCED